MSLYLPLPLLNGPLSSPKFCERNSKLGPHLLSFDLAPIDACPVPHALCKELRKDGKAEAKPICWACRELYRMEQKMRRLAANFHHSKSANCERWLNTTLSHRPGICAVRLPGVGDMYSAEWIAKVDAVIAANPQLLFWCYTRSWYSPVLWRAMQRLRRHRHLSMWLSWDRVMAAHYGAPPDRDLPWCWLAETDDDLPVAPVDLVWRYDDLPWNKSLPEKAVLGGSLVCPHENGSTRTTCFECGICWRGKAFRDAKIARLLMEAARR